MEALDRAGLDSDSLNSQGELERAAENYARTLHDAIDEAVPKIHPLAASCRKARGWWNEELDEISRTAKALQEAIQNDPTNQDFARSARTARNARRNAVKAAKQSYLMLKLQKTGPQDIWKVLRRSGPAHT